MTVSQLVLHGRFPHLSYPRRYSSNDRKIADSAMEAVGIADLGHKLLCDLSGGMRQNAYIAMALAQDTDYILLDEPTTYLDIGHQLELMKLLISCPWQSHFPVGYFGIRVSVLKVHKVF